MKQRNLFLITLFLLFSLLYSQERGFKSVIRTSEGHIINLYKGSYALVIGVSDYVSGWPDLPNATSDADAVGDLLASLGFEVTRLMNPNESQLTQALKSFVFGPGHEEDNCLVIFFAGHGHTERMTYGNDVGYIVPRDAPSPNQDKAGFMKKAINMRIIEAYARDIQAKHALFLFDSCFSGAIFDMTRAIQENIKYKTAKPVRQFITAGEADEPVPDRSIFRSQLIEALQGEADRNDDGYITGTELGEFLQEKVVNYSYGSQHPQYGKIRDPNLDKGDFVFVVEEGFNDYPVISNPKTQVAAVATKRIEDLKGKTKSETPSVAPDPQMHRQLAFKKILSRGYEALKTGRPDEALSLAKQAEDVPGYKGSPDIEWLKKLAREVIDKQRPPLVDAAKRGDLEKVRQLVADGAHVSCPMIGGDALVHACGSGQIEVVRYLVGLTGNKHFTHRSTYYSGGGTPMGEAASKGQIAVMKYLLEQGDDINFRPGPGNCTPLDNAVCGVALKRGASIATIKFLIKEGADVNARSNYHGKNQNTALWWANQRKRYDIVKLLQSYGAK